MTTWDAHIFGLDEAAVGYALAAERMLNDDDAFLNASPAVVPIFVSMLFQSLEISIKHAAIASDLFTMREARSRHNRSGHGIQKLAGLAVDRLGGDPYKSFQPIVMAMTFRLKQTASASFIRNMICGKKMKKTREAYASRRLGYGEVSEGDFAIIEPIAEWVAAVKQTALNLPSTIRVLCQWVNSPSKSKPFAIWLSK